MSNFPQFCSSYVFSHHLIFVPQQCLLNTTWTTFESSISFYLSISPCMNIEKPLIRVIKNRCLSARCDVKFLSLLKNFQWNSDRPLPKLAIKTITLKNAESNVFIVAPLIHVSFFLFFFLFLYHPELISDWRKIKKFINAVDRHLNVANLFPLIPY